MSLIKPKTATAGANRPRIGVRGAPAAAAAPKFQYKARSAEQVRERASRAVGGRDSYFSEAIQFFTARVGENTVRILPPPTDEWGHYGPDVVVHYGIGSDKSAYLCRNKMLDQPCPLCEERDKATSAGEEDLADALKPSYRTAVYVVDRAQEGKGPLLWNIPAGLDKDITKLCIEPGTGELLPVDDPNDGYDLIFTREGEGLKTKYKGIQFARKTSPLSDDTDAAQSWLDHTAEHQIDKCFLFMEYDYIAKVFEGQAPPENEEAAPAGKAAKPAARPAVKPAAAAPAGRVKIQPRGAVKPAAEPEPEPGADLPTYEELEQLDEDGLAALGEECQVEFPKDGFESIEELRAFIADALQIVAPEPEPAPATAGKVDWRDKLKKLAGKSK